MQQREQRRLEREKLFSRPPKATPYENKSKIQVDVLDSLYSYGLNSTDSTTDTSLS